MEKRMKIREGKTEHFRTDIRTVNLFVCDETSSGTENNLIHAISQLSGLHSDFKTNKTFYKQSWHQQHSFAEVR